MHHARATIACEETKRNWQRPDKNNLLMSSPVTKGEDGGRKERKRRWEERGRRIKEEGRRGKESDGRRDEGGRRKEREGAGEIWRERKQERKRNRKEERVYNKP